MLDLGKLISALPAGVILDAVIVALVFVLLVPIALRVAGLSGAQITDVLKLTMQFCLNLIEEFRKENQQK